MATVYGATTYGVESGRGEGEPEAGLIGGAESCVGRLGWCRSGEFSVPVSWPWRWRGEGGGVQGPPRLDSAREMGLTTTTVSPDKAGRHRGLGGSAAHGGAL